MTVMSSDSVMRSMYGLIVSGASVWPMKTLAQTLVVSAPDTFMTLVMTQAMPLTICCMTPRWYSTPVSDAKKMIVGSTCTANTKPNFEVSVKLPKMNSEPTRTKSSSLTKPLAIASNTSRPSGTFSTSVANTICSATPVSDELPVDRALVVREQERDADQHGEAEQAESDVAERVEHSPMSPDSGAAPAIPASVEPRPPRRARRVGSDAVTGVKAYDVRRRTRTRQYR